MIKGTIECESLCGGSSTFINIFRTIPRKISRGQTTMWWFFSSYTVFSAVLTLWQQSSGFEIDENHWLMYIVKGNAANFLCPKTSPEEHVRLFIDDRYELELSERILFHPTSGFKIKNFTNKDIGEYKCVIQKGTITSTFKKFDVRILKYGRPIDVPQIDEYKLRHVVEGANLSVNCTAQVSNADNTVIGWMTPHRKYDKRISIKRYRVQESGRTTKIGELKIQNVSFNDAGEYRCRLGRGRANWFNETVTVLTVNEPIASPNVLDEHISIAIQRGSTATLACPKTSAEDQVRLFIDGNNEMESSDRVSFNPTLGYEIKNINMMDAGVYRCKIKRDGRTQMIKTFHVQVLRKLVILGQPEIDEYKQRHVTEGQTIHFNCTVEVVYGASTSLYWIPPQKIDDRMSTKIYKMYETNTTVVSAELTIRDVSLSDAGEYKCRFRKAGTNSFNDATTVLVVRHSLGPQDEADKDSKLVYVRHGDTATLACPKTLSSDDIRLFIDGDYEVQSDRLSFDPSFGFEIKNVTIMDTGIYKCTIGKDNETRTMEKFDVQVLRGPRPIDEPEIDLFKLRHVVDGEYLRVNCSARVSATGTTFISWTGPNKENRYRVSTKRYWIIESGETIKIGELRIQNVSSIDAGEYRCRLGTHGATWIKEVATVLTVHE